MRGGHLADLHKVTVSTGRPAAPRRVGPPGPHARREMRLGAAPRSGAALIQYGSTRQYTADNG